jgi:WD40 repeat protein
MMPWRIAARVRFIPASLAALALLLAGGGPLFAVSSMLWVQDSTAEFEKGKPDGVAITSGGEILLARMVREIQIKALDEDAQPFLWSQAMDSKGNLFVGSGNDGKVFKVPKSGAGSLFYSSGDLSVQALAVDSRDNLFVGTSPEGKVYRLSPEGKPDVWFEPEERYIWALAVDRSGNLYVATGEHGVIYKVTDRGKGTPFFDSEESHIVTLAFDRQGNLLAGSSGKGLLYRISPEGKGTVVLDTALKEVNALAQDSAGHIYISAIQAESPAAGRTMRGVKARGAAAREDVVAAVAPGGGPSLSETVGEETEVSTQESPLLGPDGRQVRSQVIRIDPDGTALPVWSSETETVFSLAVSGDREVFLGTGDLGKVRRLEADGSSSLVARLASSQVTSLLAAPDGSLYAAASNSGRIYLLDKDVGDSGNYFSPPRDAKTIARWGRIGWTGATPSGTKIEVFSRSGNSTIPDATWSDWSSAYASREGSGVVSPPARFIQWKARLTRQTKGATPALQSVSLAYLPANLPPEVRKVEVNPPGVVILKPPAPMDMEAPETALSRTPPPPEGTEIASPFPPQPGKKFYQKGMRSLTWEASDPNADNLRYDLFFRGESETEWLPLVKGMTEEYFAWDSTRMPDGRYRIRVQASDAPSNLPGTEKKGEKITPPFMVDNTPPRVEASAKKEDKGFAAEVRATDTTSPVISLEYSLDGAPWVAAAPADGISDSLSEQFRIPLERLPSGEHTLLLKAADSEGNVGTGMLRFSGG